MKRLRFSVPLLFLAAGWAAYAPLLWSVPYRPDVPRFLLALAPTYIFLAVAIWLIIRNRIGWGPVLLLALLLRVAFIFQPPTLSEDAYRYLWDGQLVYQGADPYRDSPSAVWAGGGGDAELYPRMAHRDRNSIYPPLAQLLFAIPALTGKLSGIIAWKLLLLAIESGLVYLFIRHLRIRVGAVALWLFHPLVVVEFYSSGHLDLAGLVLAGWSLYLAASRRGLAAGLAWGGSVLTKVFPLLLLPLLLSQLPNRKHRGALLGGAALGLVFVVAVLGWFLGGLPNWGALLDILVTYHDTWQFNSLIFYYLPCREAAGRVVSALLLAAALLVSLANRRRDVCELFTRYYFLFLLWLLLTPTLHPWYVTWVVLVFPVLRGRYWCGWYLSAVVPVSYLTYWFTPPGDHAWLLWLEFAPAWCFFLRDLRAYYDVSTCPENNAT